MWFMSGLGLCASDFVCVCFFLFFSHLSSFLYYTYSIGCCHVFDEYIHKDVQAMKPDTVWLAILFF